MFLRSARGDTPSLPLLSECAELYSCLRTVSMQGMYVRRTSRATVFLTTFFLENLKIFVLFVIRTCSWLTLQIKDDLSKSGITGAVRCMTVCMAVCMTGRMTGWMTMLALSYDPIVSISTMAAIGGGGGGGGGGVTLIFRYVPMLYITHLINFCPFSKCPWFFYGYYFLKAPSQLTNAHKTYWYNILHFQN